jgi:hypothetical protein
LYRCRCLICSSHLVSVQQPECHTYAFPHSHGSVLTPVNFSCRLCFGSLMVREVFVNRMWTVFMLNHPSNLLILYDVVCLSGKMATPVSFYFYGVMLFS